MDDGITKLKQLIGKSDNIVIFSGAGVSTESGLKDFRSDDGLYNEQYKYPPETILSHTFFVKMTKEFYEYYFDKMINTGVKPNVAHEIIAKLEEIGKVKTVITQNIDGLHQAAGSKNVIELHGSVHRNYCTVCGKFYSLEDILLKKDDGVPHCDCGGIIKPDVVLYEEGLDENNIERAIFACENADLVIVVGTSLNVYPAAGFLRYVKGKLAIINKQHTSYDSCCDVIIHDGIGKVLSIACEDLLQNKNR